MSEFNKTENFYKIIDQDPDLLKSLDALISRYQDFPYGRDRAGSDKGVGSFLRRVDEEHLQSAESFKCHLAMNLINYAKRSSKESPKRSDILELQGQYLPEQFLEDMAIEFNNRIKADYGLCFSICGTIGGYPVSAIDDPHLNDHYLNHDYLCKPKMHGSTESARYEQFRATRIPKNRKYTAVLMRVGKKDPLRLRFCEEEGTELGVGIKEGSHFEKSILDIFTSEDKAFCDINAYMTKVLYNVLNLKREIDPVEKPTQAEIKVKKYVEVKKQFPNFGKYA